MRHEEYLNASGSGCGHDLAKVTNQINRGRNILHAIPKLAPFADEVVVWIDQK
jgi:hypothetical protein